MNGIQLTPVVGRIDRIVIGIRNAGGRIILVLHQLLELLAPSERKDERESVPRRPNLTLPVAQEGRLKMMEPNSVLEGQAETEKLREPNETR